MKNLMRLFAIVALCLPSVGASSELEGLSQIFERTWNTGYAERQCGLNIQGLIRNGVDAGLDFHDAEILTITNTGSSVFGLVNAERARRQEPTLKVIEKNWYHHVILVHDGHVFDFDFLTEPTVLPVAEYFERMFFDEISPPEFDYLIVGREEKLRAYRVTFQKVSDYISRGQSTVTEMTLGKYLAR